MNYSARSINNTIKESCFDAYWAAISDLDQKWQCWRRTGKHGLWISKSNHRIQGIRITGMFSNNIKIYQTNNHFLTCFSDSSWINMASKNHILWIYAMSCTQNKYIYCALFLGNRWTKASWRKKKDSHHFNCQVPRRNAGDEHTNTVKCGSMDV